MARRGEDHRVTKKVWRSQKTNSVGAELRHRVLDLHAGRSACFEFRTFFGRGLQAKREGLNEVKYMKTGEVRI